MAEPGQITVVVDRKPDIVVLAVRRGAAGPPGPPGPEGPPGITGGRRWYGEGPPGVVVGAAPGDEYVDRNTGDLYKLT